MKIKRFIKTAFVFLTGNVLSKIISFLLLPIYTEKIDPAQFGNYDVAFTFINLIAPIAFFQIWDGMYRISFDYKNNDEKHGIISNCFAVSFIGLVIYAVLFPIINCFFKIQYFVLVFIYGLLYAINYIYTYAARAFLSNKLFVFSGVLATLSTAILNIILIVGFGFGIDAIYISSIFGLLIQQGLIEIKLGVLRYFKFKHIDKKIIKEMLCFSIPLCVTTIFYWFLNGFTKIIIQNQIGDYANGLYAVANKFGGLITLIVSVVQFAWNETIYIMTSDSKETHGKNYSLCMDVMTNGVVIGLSVFILVSKLVFPILIDTSYNEALFLIPPTILGVAANALASFIATIFMAEKSNKLIMHSSIMVAILNVILGFTLTKYFGIYGTVTGLAVSFFALALIRYIKIVTSFGVKLNHKRMIINFILLSISILTFYLSKTLVIDMVILLLILLTLFFLFGKIIFKMFNSIFNK